ncbi:hypothetical protein SteCoe_31048 [Stentor coeruleus]|uniref:SBF1/SBF2 domain-containing protein n=1 Tax=Stentor coeruleus TaxID=5963 RepID=A0A1R2B2B5_9CILI|nr:hypothetical protein SteCoe_31048 [Stentor coeruleus]
MNLNDCLESLHIVSIGNRKESEYFLNALGEWALTEEMYSKGMEMLSNHIGLQISTNSFFDQLRMHMLSLSQKARNFSESLNTHIIVNYKKLLSKQNESAKNTYLKGKELNNYMAKKYKRVIKKTDKYFSSCKECQQVALELDKNPSVPHKAILLEKIKLLKNQSDSNFDNYKTAILSFNRALQKFYESIRKIIKAYNIEEEMRCKSFKESLEKLKIFINQKAEGLVIGDLILKEPIIPKIIQDDDFFLEDLIINQFESSHPLFEDPEKWFAIHTLKNDKNPNFKESSLDEIYKSDCEKMLEKVWKGDYVSKDDFMKFSSRLKEPLGRKAWCFSLNQQRSRGFFIICEKGFNKLSELMTIAINECEKANDISTAKICIILSQTFYKKIDTSKIYLQSNILNHNLWKNLKFWGKVVQDSIYEELNKEGMESLEGTSQEKCIVFSQLVSYGNIMMSFNLSYDTIEALIGEYAKIYNFAFEEIQGVMQAVSDSLSITCC